MNKFHVVLLSVLAPVVLHAVDEKKDASWISTETKNKLIILGTDGAAYNYAPDVVGRIKNAGNFITQNRLHVPAFITNMANKLPNAVNSENANRVFTIGLVYGLSKCCKFGYNTEKSSAKAKLLYGTESIKEGAKIAVNSMKDATVAIAAVEALSALANKFGGERAEQIATNYASWIEYAKTAGFVLAKQASKAYTWEVC